VKAADSTKLRRQLVGELERRELIRSERVRDAFLAVPRELFVPGFAAREGLEAVYRDEAIPTKHGEHGVPLSSSSQPAIMALMLEQLELEEGMRVLEVGPVPATTPRFFRCS
jgi:protein-L-isoaspartate(D-aspartate) O-methyltransferase